MTWLSSWRAAWWSSVSPLPSASSASWWLRTKSETATIAARAMTSAASFHILFFDRLCSVKAGAFVDVPTEHPLLFCRYEPFLCLPCQHGEEDGLWRVATLPADCCRGLARAANGSPFPCWSARLLFRLSCSLYWHVVSINRQMQSYEFFLKKRAGITEKECSDFVFIALFASPRGRGCNLSFTPPARTAFLLVVWWVLQGGVRAVMLLSCSLVACSATLPKVADDHT